MSSISSQSFDMAGGGYIGEMAQKSMIAPNEGFAPEVEERKIIHTSSMTNEVERGKFSEAETKLKNIVDSSNSYLLNQNVNKHGTEKKSYYTGNYQLKVDTENYQSVVAQLKDIGEVQSFNENQDDVTRRYTNLEIEIAAEEERLNRYESMYAEAEEINDKITLNDRIFDQERRVNYLNDALMNIDQNVEYSTINVELNEKRSDYANVAFVKFSELINSVVESANTLINLVVILLPWALALLIIKFIVGRFRRNRIA